MKSHKLFGDADPEPMTLQEVKENLENHRLVPETQLMVADKAEWPKRVTTIDGTVVTYNSHAEWIADVQQRMKRGKHVG